MILEEPSRGLNQRCPISMEEVMSKFNDRQQAGEFLAKKLLHLAHERPVVLALPRGGLPVAGPIARELGAPLDILAVKKIGAPQNPELAIGAVAEDGYPILDDDLIARLNVDRRTLDSLILKKAQEAAQQSELFRREFPMQTVGGRNVIVVDDGLATGATMEAAVRVLRQKRRVKKITVAVPVGSRPAIEKIRALVDEVIYLTAPADFYAVGAWYRSFEQVSDEEALAALRSGHLETTEGQLTIQESSVEIPFGKTKKKSFEGRCGRATKSTRHGDFCARKWQ
jgi:putative phosphoribosyl transferase